MVPLNPTTSNIQLKATKVNVNSGFTRLTSSPVCLAAAGANFDATSYGAFKIPKGTKVAGLFLLFLKDKC